MANKQKDLRAIQRKCRDQTEIQKCYDGEKAQLFGRKPEYISDWPEIPIYNPKKYKFMGFTKKCKGWYVGVIVNRHFINHKQWKIKDYSFDTRG